MTWNGKQVLMVVRIATKQGLDSRNLSRIRHLLEINILSTFFHGSKELTWPTISTMEPIGVARLYSTSYSIYNASRNSFYHWSGGKLPIIDFHHAHLTSSLPDSRLCSWHLHLEVDTRSFTLCVQCNGGGKSLQLVAILAVCLRRTVGCEAAPSRSHYVLLCLQIRDLNSLTTDCMCFSCETSLPYLIV